MNNYTPDAKKVSDALKSMAQILDRIAAEAPEVEICAAEYNEFTGEMRVHIYLGIDAVADLYSCPVQVVARNDPKYTYQKETIIDGVKLFEIMSAGKGNL